MRQIAIFGAERLYLGAPRSDSGTQLGSSIFVVDISDPTGLLLPGATIQITAEVSSRWALDESEGVLRVVSQRYSYDNSLRPRVETFRIDASDSFVPLGAAELSVVAGELRSVRFDGSRAYATTQRGPRVFPKDPGAGSDSPAQAQTPSVARLEIPPPSAACPADWRLSTAFVSASRAHLVYPEPASDAQLLPQMSRIVTVDLAGGAPATLADTSVAIASVPVHRAPVALAASGSAVVAAGSALAFMEREFDFDAGPSGEITRSRLAVVDLARPEQPSIAWLDLPAGIGATDLLVSEQLIATSHYVALPDDPARVAFYLDRVDVSNPRKPRLLPAINIPGSLLGFDAAAGRAIVVEYIHSDAGSQTSLDCNQRFVFPHLERLPADANQGECSGTLQSVHLIELDAGQAVILGGLELDPHRALAALAYADNRLFARISSGGAYLDTDCRTLQCPYSWASPTGDRLPMLLVLGGSQRGELESGWLELDNGDRAGGPPIAASQHWAALWSGYRGDVVIVDAADATQPTQVRSLPTGLHTVQQLQLGTDRAVAALGPAGSRSIPLNE